MRSIPAGFMTDQIVITEKSSQAKDVRAAGGSRYGAVLPAEGHLLDLCEPEEVNPARKRWAAVLLRPEGLYGTRPAPGGNKTAKLKAIREALRTAKRVWLATDCDREGQLIGQEILEHCGYRGEVLRVLFTAQDAQTIREAFGRARPNGEHGRLYAAAVARRQADQIYNLSLTRNAVCLREQLRTADIVALYDAGKHRPRPRREPARWRRRSCRSAGCRRPSAGRRGLAPQQPRDSLCWPLQLERAISLAPARFDPAADTRPSRRVVRDPVPPAGGGTALPRLPDGPFRRVLRLLRRTAASQRTPRSWHRDCV